MRYSRTHIDIRTVYSRIHIYVCTGLFAVFFFCLAGSFAQEASAAFGAGNANCANFNNTSGTSLSCTVAINPIEAGNIAVLFFASDNFSTTDTTANLLASVSDTEGNEWIVQGCYTNGQGTAAPGATSCIATARITTTIPNTLGSITATLSNARTAKAMQIREFTVGVGNEVAVAGTVQNLANDAADPGSMTVGSLPSKEYLFIRNTALERSITTWTATTNFTSVTCVTGGNTGTSAINTCGEYRIFTGTSLASNPTGTAVDNASVYLALEEVPAVKFSGVLYEEDGITPLTSTTSIKLAISTSSTPTIYSTVSNSVTGAWEIVPSGATIPSGTPVVIWVDGDPEVKANIVTRAEGMECHSCPFICFRCCTRCPGDAVR